MAGDAGIQPHDHANLLLAPVHVGGEQLHQALLGFKSDQHLAQPLPIHLGRNQVGHPVHEDFRPAVVGRQRSLAAKFLDRRKHLMIRSALKIHAAGNFGADAVDGPAAKVLVQVAGRGFEFDVGQFAVEDQYPVLHGSGLGHDHGQHPAGGQAGKMNVLQHLRSGRGRQGDAQPAGQQRQHLGSPLQVVVRAGNAGEPLLDLPAAFFAQRAHGECSAASGLRCPARRPTCPIW